MTTTSSSNPELAGLTRALSDVDAFSRVVLGRGLRPYQIEVARAILQSVEERAGRTFTVMMPRQSGKNETSAQIEAFLLARHQLIGGSIVKAAPTFKPQIINSIQRLSSLLENPLTKGRWTTPYGYTVALGRALCMFFSAQPGANVVGGTASLLLECDEAQDVDPAKWDKEFVPMGSTGNATRVFWGTPWSDTDLLARSIDEAKTAEKRDGIRRHFDITIDQVTAANPLYGHYVEAEIARLGKDHPIVRTQYLMQTLAQAGKLLSLDQLATLQGDHQPESAPRPSPLAPRHYYVAAIDVAGADEEDPDGVMTRVNAKRDSTVLGIARVEEPHVAQSSNRAVVEPILKLVRIHSWTGEPHRKLYPLLLQLVQAHWKCRTVVVDATGVGGGLAAFLGAALGPQILRPYVYNAATKSALAYGLLGAVNASRLSVYAESPSDPEVNDARRELLKQAQAAIYALRANQQMTFNVPERLGHDDHLNMLALLTQAVEVGAARSAVGRSGRPEQHGPFGNQRPLRR